MPTTAPADRFEKTPSIDVDHLALDLGTPKLSLSMKFSPVVIFAFLD